MNKRKKYSHTGEYYRSSIFPYDAVIEEHSLQYEFDQFIQEQIEFQFLLQHSESAIHQ